ncbi:MAG TPA: CHAD domain-containing protein [Rudaea sp.]|nr:CHAD domain-containing protein [Rudaea sp.]
MSRPRNDPAFALLYFAIDKALADLRVQRPVDTRVHSARKALKKARAALRLLRPNLVAGVYERENIALRDAGRRLSPLRDAKSLVAAVDLLGKPRGAKGPYATKIAGLRRALQRQLAEAWSTYARGAVQSQCAQLVQSCRERMLLQERQATGTATLLDSLREIYRKVRNAHARALAERTPETLHEWRKQTKYLHTAAAALRDAGTRDLSSLVKRTGDIAAWLGDDHDLVALRAAIERAGMADEAILARIERRRAKLHGRALTLGARVLQRKPKRFVASLTAPQARGNGARTRSPRKRNPTATSA